VNFDSISIVVQLLPRALGELAHVLDEHHGAVGERRVDLGYVWHRGRRRQGARRGRQVGGLQRGD